MKSRVFLALSGVGSAAAMIPCLHADAAFQNLSVTTSLGAPLGRITYRVYANFTHPDDNVNTVYGSPTTGAMTIESRNADNTGPGSPFFNPITSHGNAPTPDEVFGGTPLSGLPPPPNAAWDTFFTIGVHAGGTGSGPDGADECTGTPGMPIFISGNFFTNNNVGWFTAGPVEQGRAGWLGDGDPLLRVLIMQLTVSSTSGVRGTLNIAGFLNTELAGGVGFTATQQTFAAFPIPGPGVLAMLMAPLAMSRRRRRGMNNVMELSKSTEAHQ